MQDGDVIELEQSYFALGFSGIGHRIHAQDNLGGWQSNWTMDSRLGGTLTMQIQYDIGAGWNGTWIDSFDDATLDAVVVDPTVGVKIKMRVTAVGQVDYLGRIMLELTTTYADRKLGIYPIDQEEYTTTITPLQPNSEVRIYRASDGAELAGVEDSGGEFAYTYVYVSDETVDIVIHHKEFEPVRLKGIVLTNVSASIPIQQRFDRNYSNP